MNNKSLTQLYPESSISDENPANTKIRKPALSPLKFKGYLFNFLLVSYIAFITVVVLSQRNQPLEQLEQYQKIQKAQEALVQADMAAFHIVTVLFSDVSQTDLENVVHYFSGLRNQYINLQHWFPEQAEAFKALVETIPVTLNDPTENNLKKIHFHLARSKSELDRLMTLNSVRLIELVEDYQKRNDSVVVTTLTLGIIGLVLMGGITSLFFNRLKKDLNALQKRTAEIVEGYRGEPLPVYRNDEVGHLTQGVNYMANALAEREQALEIQRSTVSFMEKMVAIDSLTGGIAHEIGNPVTCIAGLAEVLKSDEHSQLSEESRQSLEAILGHIDGLVRLTRELSVFDTHKSDEYEWLDINSLVSNTCSIFNYDKRWTNIHINLDLDHSVPAIFASVNQLTQLLSNILENAMDAEHDIQNPEVTISTRQQDPEHLLIQIRDNGQGMDQDVMAHIFDPFFSTKPVGLGTGLGLAICWSIVRAHDGTIKATSTISRGSEISIVLPVKKAESNE